MKEGTSELGFASQSLFICFEGVEQFEKLYK